MSVRDEGFVHYGNPKRPSPAAYSFRRLPRAWCPRRVLRSSRVPVCVEVRTDWIGSDSTSCCASVGRLSPWWTTDAPHAEATTDFVTSAGSVTADSLRANPSKKDRDDAYCGGCLLLAFARGQDVCLREQPLQNIALDGGAISGAERAISDCQGVLYKIL